MIIHDDYHLTIYYNANEIPVESCAQKWIGSEGQFTDSAGFFAMAAQPVWLEVALLLGFAESMVFFFQHLGVGKFNQSTKKFWVCEMLKRCESSTKNMSTFCCFFTIQAAPTSQLPG